MEFQLTENVGNVFASPWAVAQISDTIEATICPLTFGRARLNLGVKGDDFYFDSW